MRENKLHLPKCSVSDPLSTSRRLCSCAPYRTGPSRVLNTDKIVAGAAATGHARPHLALSH